MNTGIPRRYKTLIAVALVAGPLIWLLFTADGQRRTDLVLMPLLGRPNIQLSLSDLSSQHAEGDIRARVPEADLQCAQAETAFGDRVCTARIGAVGRLPAEALVFFFSSGKLRAAKLIYRRDVHGELLTSLSRRLGEGETVRRDSEEEAVPVVSWRVTDGVLLLNAESVPLGEEPALLWLSGAAVDQRIDAVRAGGAEVD